MEGLHLNTLIVPVAWETIEPEEGMFTFENPSGLIDQARETWNASGDPLVWPVEKWGEHLCTGVGKGRHKTIYQSLLSGGVPVRDYFTRCARRP